MSSGRCEAGAAGQSVLVAAKVSHEAIFRRTVDQSAGPGKREASRSNVGGGTGPRCGRAAQ